ncbi:hypothetical protein LB543_01515 [Mesorhizobium sp. ESP7-2]|uniref:hypothetical protein n=1 Tax=Mesorhizobium sp. ESP7-2 TaxID=2876622 RepID=UPI001CCB8317|nr:hypothetical protein [Mesorhizobium sp. ESP7-2]MBZ9705407.1 hypothetical protein [Mesorhizobium sp. ESP7-2]
MKLPEITYPLKIDTIGKLLALGGEMSVHCRTTGCDHGSRLNLVALGRRIGFDHSSKAQDLAPYFYCPKCRAAGRDDKRIGFILRPLTSDHCEWPRERELWRQEIKRSRAK